MGDVLTFTPRPKPAAPKASELLTGPEIRVSLEEAAQVALDAADRIIAVLDRMDGDLDLEDGGDAEPTLAAPENHTGPQVVWMSGNDEDREAGTPETVLTGTAARAEATVIEVQALRWGGRGNVLAAAGSFIVDLMGQG
jgi:hypothetical protein